jgi:hypothetical protein
MAERIIEAWSESAQQIDAERVKRADEGARGLFRPDDFAEAAPHLARRLVRERHREDGLGIDAPVHQVRDAHGDDARLAGAGAGQHEHGTFGRRDGAALFGVEGGEDLQGGGG